MCDGHSKLQTKNFAKTLTSLYRTIVDWVDNIGFKLFECVIYHKNGTEGAWWTNRFRVDHEYIPLFFKGKNFTSLFRQGGTENREQKHGGKRMTGFGSRKSDGTTQKSVTRVINPTKCPGTVWDYMMAGDEGSDQT